MQGAGSLGAMAVSVVLVGAVALPTLRGDPSLSRREPRASCDCVLPDVAYRLFHPIHGALQPPEFSPRHLIRHRWSRLGDRVCAQ